MKTRQPRLSTGSVIVLFAASCLTACDAGPRSGHRRDLPASDAALRTVEQALQNWKNSPDIERTTTSVRPIMFVEQQQPPGQRLVGFEILGETPGYEDEGYRRVLARLSLTEPEESVVAVYYVFGQDPIWVYRSEDFEMIMRMDKSMMPPPPGEAAPGPP